MLAGLGGAMLPVVLHLLSRSRFRTVDWAAMMFLQGLDPRQRQSTRLKQFILLLMRMLLVGLLAVALARPVVNESFAAVAGEGRVAAVIVVDASASTALVENGKPRSELIRQAAIQIISSLHKGDEAAVIVAGGSSGRVPPRLGSDLARVADEITAIVPGGRANLAEAMSRAADLLNRPQDINRRLYVVADRQAVSWREVDAAFRSAWGARMRREPVAMPLVIVPVGGVEADNLAVQRLAVVNPPLVRDQPVEIEAQIRNFGSIRRAGVPIALSLNGREVGRATVDLPPDSTVPARITAKINDAGPQLVTAAFQRTPGLNTGLTADDSLDFAVEISDPTRVLIYSGDERQPKTAAESYFAAVALQPFGSSGRGGVDPCQVTVRPIESATAADLQGTHVVILANVAGISPSFASSLEQWVFDGGGLMVAPGSLTRAAAINNRLFRAGAGVLPAGLIDPSPNAQPAGLGQLDPAHPALQFLRGRAEIPPAIFGRWFKLNPLRSDARTIAALASGDPWAVENAAGRGRVMLLATPIDADWSTLPLTSFYLPFMQSAARWLAGAGADRNLAVGQPIVAVWTGSEIRAATIVLPDGKTVPVEPLRTGDRSEFRHTATDQPGVYRLRLVTPKRELNIPFVVHAPSEESDLSSMSRKDWDALARDLEATVIQTPQQSIVDVLATNRAGREVWGLLILAVIVLGLIESWLAGRWSKQD